jgi:hypothetical protein
MKPTTSPRLISKETSFSAQMLGRSLPALPFEECRRAERRQRKGEAKVLFQSVKASIKIVMPRNRIRGIGQLRPKVWRTRIQKREKILFEVLNP